MILKDKILLYTPVLYKYVIDDLVDNRKYRNRTDFINEAIREKIESEGIDLTPKTVLKLEDWWDDWINKQIPKT